MDTATVRSADRAPTQVSRRRRRRLGAPLAVLIAVALAVIAPQACAACSCMVMTFAEAADQADVVFVGTVTGSEAGQRSEFGPSIAVTFAVSEVYQGSASAESVVSTADNSAACGFDFEQGQTYLVMALSGPDGLQTNLCTGTSLAGQVAEEDLESLGPPAAPGAAMPGGGAGGGDVGGGESGSARPWFIVGGVTLGALLTGGLLWWHRRRATDDPATDSPTDDPATDHSPTDGSAGPEIRRTSPGEALPHTEALWRHQTARAPRHGRSD